MGIRDATACKQIQTAEWYSESDSRNMIVLPKGAAIAAQAITKVMNHLIFRGYNLGSSTSAMIVNRPKRPLRCDRGILVGPGCTSSSFGTAASDFPVPSAFVYCSIEGCEDDLLVGDTSLGLVSSSFMNFSSSKLPIL